jgi:hypothetical protein
MFSTIYNGIIGEVTNKSGEIMKKPKPVIQYKFLKSVEREDEYSSYSTILKKTSNGTKICALYNRLCIILFLSSVAEPRIKTEVQFISTLGGTLFGWNDLRRDT